MTKVVILFGKRSHYPCKVYLDLRERGVPSWVRLDFPKHASWDSVHEYSLYQLSLMLRNMVLVLLLMLQMPLYKKKWKFTHVGGTMSNNYNLANLP